MTTSPATATAAGADDVAGLVGLPTGRPRLVLLLGALSAFGPMSLDMYLPGFPVLARDLHTTAAPVQLTITSCLVGLAAGQVLAGPLSDRFGRRRPLVAGLLLYAVASLLCAGAPGIGALVGLRLLQGLGGSAGIVVARAVVRDLYSGIEAARFFALLMLVNGLAPILAPLFGAQVLHVAGWRAVFVVLTGFGLLLAVLVSLGLPETLPPERRQPGGVRSTLGTFGRLLRDRAFLGCALSAGFVFGSLFAYIAGSSFVLQTKYGLSPQTFSLVFGGNAFGLIAASQVSARVVGRYGPRALLTTGIVISAVGAAALLLSVLLDFGLPAVLPSLLLVVMSVGLVAPNAAALALAGHPRTAGSASALLGLAQYIVGGLAAPLVGLAGSGSAVPLAVVVAVSSAAAVLTRVLVLSPAARQTA
ncbi:MAG: multidrug effflux MFS transporter [Actinobacteria bacterium]|nr:multidrug effflux MFS transporter [Actinomycetota bacterium]MCA1721027.1 multidrug effflux MFS transporter [Actinomycetota bacterium]